MKKYISALQSKKMASTTAQYKPTGPYNGFVKNLAEDRSWTIREAAEYFRIPQIIDRIDDWAICEDGLYSLLIDYVIDRSQINESDWEEHMNEKSWVNIETFRAARKKAIKIWEA